MVLQYECMSGPQEDIKLEKTKNKIKIEKGTRIFYMTTPQKTKQIKGV
jgi:hypothetical protein